MKRLATSQIQTRKPNATRMRSPGVSEIDKRCSFWKLETRTVIIVKMTKENASNCNSRSSNDRRRLSLRKLLSPYSPAIHLGKLQLWFKLPFIGTQGKNVVRQLMTVKKCTVLTAIMLSISLLNAHADNSPNGLKQVGDPLHNRPKRCVNALRNETIRIAGQRNPTQCSPRKVRRREASAAPRRKTCMLDVLRSEELSGAPPFYHLVKATLRITVPSGLAFETNFEGLFPWQIPPPRQGQRLRSGSPSSASLQFSLLFRGIIVVSDITTLRHSQIRGVAVK